MDINNSRSLLPWFFGIAASFLLLYFVSPVLTPFLIALFIAYVSNPLVTRLERDGVARWVSMLTGIFIVVLLIGVVSLLVLPTLKEQVSGYLERLPNYIDQLKQWINPLFGALHTIVDEVKDTEVINEVSVVDLAKDALPAGDKTVDLVRASTMLLVNTLTNLFLIPVITFYLLRDWNSIAFNLKRVLPSSRRDQILEVAEQVDTVLKSFLSGQVLVMISLGVMYFIGLSVIGLQFSLLIGVISGLLSFVPFLGTAVGLLMAGLVMITQSDQLFDVWKVLAVFSVGQFIEGNFLTPKLVGEKINLHPVIVIFAVLAGGQLFGFMGILFALPAAAVGRVVIKTLAEEPV